MRAFVLVAVSACATAPPEQKRLEDLARTQVALPLLPAYHGAVHDDPCTVHLQPDSSAIQADRQRAMLARLRPGSQLVLDRTGVRPQWIVLPPGGPGPVRTKRQAIARAKQFLAATAELWGISTRFGDVGVDKPIRHRRNGPRWWAVEVVVDAAPAPAWHERAGRIAMLIDAANGRVAATFTRPLDPFTDICPIPTTPPNQMFADAVVASDPRVLRVDALDPSTVGKPAYTYLETEDGVRLVVEVSVQPRGASGEAANVMLDPGTARIVLVEHPREVYDDWLQPRGDASVLRDVLEPDRDANE